MKFWEIPWRGKKLAYDAGELGDLIDAQGTPQFGPVLYRVVNQNAPIAMLNVTTMELGNIFRNHWMEVGPHIDKAQVVECSEAYRKKFMHSDPVLWKLIQLWSRPTLHQPKIILQTMEASSIRDLAWRERSYTSTGMVERFAMGAGHPHTGWVFLTMFRHETHGLLTEAEKAWLADMAPLLLRILMRHENIYFEPVPRSTNLSVTQRRLQQVRSDLTVRETEVCSRILQGKSLEIIAKELDIGINTVKTYRSRAFARMGISSRFELLSIFLG